MISPILEKHPRWKGGKYKDIKGYIWVYIKDHPYSKDNHIREHRLVYEKYLGRYLLFGEFIHHKNGIKDDNRIENLLLVNNKSHRKYHPAWNKGLKGYRAGIPRVPLGYKFSKEHNDRIRLKLKGRHITWGYKISRSKMGHGWPEGFHERQSLAQKRRYETIVF